VLAVRSTLPPEFVDQLPQIVTTLREEAGRSPVPVLLNPEFTREAHAVDDFLSPGRVVIGIGADPDERGLKRMRELYEPVSCPVLVMPAIDASFAKLGSNLFLATKISFANELATLCDAYGATVDNVVGALALDARIGGAFLGAGVGFGGSCLPHQVKMIVKTARQAGIPVPMLAAVDDINLGQRARVAGMLDDMLPGGLSGARIAVLGLTFKPDTDDLRDAPSLTVAQILLERGATVIAHDPMERARTAAATMVNGLDVVDTAREALDGADAAVLLTEWREYRELDWSEVRPLLRGDVVLDGRNALDPQRVVDAGLRYASFGRGMRHPEPHALTSGEVAEPAWVEGVA
jgi:UDPglucose 6-dehydrogenase